MLLSPSSLLLVGDEPQRARVLTNILVHPQSLQVLLLLQLLFHVLVPLQKALEVGLALLLLLVMASYSG